jgi:transposase
MIDTQGRLRDRARFNLQSERMGPLPLVNHFIERIGLEELLCRHVPSDARCTVAHARALGVLLRSLIVEREPIYRQQEAVGGFASGMFGLDAQEMEHLSDDRLGRALDRLFDADRAALLTEVVLAVGERFGVRFDELHNDSTSISFCGSYRAAKGRTIRGRSAPAIVFGHSKAHRPDLKQLLFILSMTADGHVPVAFRCTDGNVNDSRTHIETWNTLRTIAGRADFLYVADSKLCSRENMDHIDRAGGRFVTVLPRNRKEDAEFRKWIQTHTPEWVGVWDRDNPGAATVRAIAGMSIAPRYCRRRSAWLSGSGARCSRCARKHADARTSPPLPKNSCNFASDSPAPRRGCAAPARSI